MPVFGHRMRAEWALDPGVLYLNHGTVGATPRRVLARQQAIRDEMEKQPARFLLRECSGLVGAPRTSPTLLRLAAAEVADFCGCEGDDLVFVDNATAGVNAVLQSLELRAGDEILVTDHTYGAVTMAAAFFARRPCRDCHCALPALRQRPDAAVGLASPDHAHTPRDPRPRHF